MTTAIATSSNPLSPLHPSSVALIDSIKSNMATKDVTWADIVAGTHLSDRTLGKMLNHQSALRLRDFFAIARVLDVAPSALFTSVDTVSAVD